MRDKITIFAPVRDNRIRETREFWNVEVPLYDNRTAALEIYEHLAGKEVKVTLELETAPPEIRRSWPDRADEQEPQPTGEQGR